MALKMDVTTAGGLSAPGAYVRAVPDGFVKNDDGKWRMVVQLTVFKDAQTAAEGGHALTVPSLDRLKIPYPLTATGNALKWAYTAVKKLAPFVGAEDLL